MHSNSHTEWLAKYSNIQEQLGQEPSYPLTAMQIHIRRELENQNDVIKYASETLSSDIVVGIKNSTSKISGDLQTGFDYLADINLQGFDNLSKDIKNLSSSMSWYFNELIEQVKTSNLLLENIALLLRIPDIQKERQYYIEQGLKFFVNAKGDKSLFDDALDNLLKAEKIERTDFFLLQKIGLIYLFSKKHLNIDKALEYFLKSAKYSYSEIHDFSTQTINHLNNDVSVEFSTQVNTVIDTKGITAYSYLYAARCHYLNKKYENAYKYASKAYQIIPDFIEAGYDIAKYLCVLNRVEEAIKVLEVIIKKDRYVTLKIINDFDIISKKEVQIFLQVLTDNSINQARNRINELQKYNVKNNAVDEIINSAIINFNTKTFLGALKSLDILRDEYNWQYNYIYYKEENKEKYFNNFNSIIKQLSNNTKLKRKISNTKELKKEELINFSKQLINFPEIQSENKKSSLDSFLRNEEYFQNYNPFFKKTEKELINLIDLKISNTNTNRATNSMIAAIIAFPLGIVMGAVFGLLLGMAGGLFIGLIGLIFGATFSGTFDITVWISIILFSLFAGLLSSTKIYHEKSEKNIVAQIWNSFISLITGDD